MKSTGTDRQGSKRELAIQSILETAKRFPSRIIAREQVGEFTGGALSARYLANLDCKGDGVPGAFKLGRRQCYNVDALADWLIRRLAA